MVPRAMSPVELAAIILGAFFLTLAGTGLMRRAALRRGMLDVPNDRSSHAVPTPRGGGLALVAAFGVVLAYLAFQYGALNGSLGALAGAVAIAGIGFIDDCRHVRPAVRLLVHFGAALWALWWLGGLPPLQFGANLVNLGVAGYLIGAIGIVWTLNLFNFMDGIDGIAGVEGAFIGIAGAILLFVQGVSTPLVALNLALGAACCGFLCWNWAPARIFMGDAGSGSLGFVVAVLALCAARERPEAFWVYLILNGVFIADATVTLLRRVRRRERLHEAHRTHAYQRVAFTWKSHSRVSLSVTGLNVFGLLPCAALAEAFPACAAMIAGGALLTLAVLAFSLGAGMREPDRP
jgi:Fuc2NAc and GlcNAc transferase